MIPSDYFSFVVAIYTLIQLWPASVTSWFRTPARNQHVGGHPKSEHLRGLAVDLVPDDPNTLPEGQRVASELGLYALIRGSYLHVQAFEVGHDVA